MKYRFDDEKTETEWLCADCGKGKRYMGQIAGTVAKHCQKCKRIDTIFYKYEKDNVQRLL